MKESEKYYPCNLFFTNKQNKRIAADLLTPSELADKLTAMQLAFIRQQGHEVVPEDKID